MARAVVFENATPLKLQELTDYSRMQVYRILHKPLFIEEIDRLTNEIEEYEIVRKRKAFSTICDKIEAIVEEQCRLAVKAKNENVRSRTGNAIMAYIFRKKDAEEEEDKNKYIAVQPHPRESIKDDPDVSPAAAENILKFKKAVNKKVVNDDR